MSNFLYIFTLTATLVVIVRADGNSQYCNIKTCYPENTQTICQYGYLTTSNKCGKIETDFLTYDETVEILDRHNKYRARVASGQETRGKYGGQPGATNLELLYWDTELAEVAQTWADQCTYRHDDCPDVSRFPVGQNIGYKGTTQSYDVYKFTDIVDMWYNEVDKFDGKQVEDVTDYTGVGHYTQMMWADTKALGCGGIRYNDGGKFNRTYLVCNYGPAGNYEEGEMYKTS